MTNQAARQGIPRPDGLILAPFRALRYDEARVPLEQVLAPPYDVIDEPLRAELEARDSRNVVRLTLPRDGDGETGYERAARALAGWRGRDAAGGRAGGSLRL